MIRKVAVSISIDKRTLSAIERLQGFEQNRSEAIAGLIEYAIHHKLERV